MANRLLHPLTADLYAYEFIQGAPGGLKLPTRTTVARLSDGTVWVHSPGPLSDAAFEQLDRIGPVAHVVAPTCLHHLHIGSFAARYPGATYYAAPGLRDKRADLSFQRELGPAELCPWPDDLEMVPLEGAPKSGEVVFLHKPSRSLIVSDLVFNITEPHGLMTHLILALTGTRGRLAHSRLWHSLVSDAGAFEASLGRVLRLEFDRLVVGHGEVIPHGARDALARALRVRLAA